MRTLPLFSRACIVRTQLKMNDRGDYLVCSKPHGPLLVFLDELTGHNQEAIEHEPKSTWMDCLQSDRALSL